MNVYEKKISLLNKIRQILVPNCGKTPPTAGSRLINAKESTKWYPWMTFIRRYMPIYPTLPDGRPDKTPVWDREYDIKTDDCTGSMISYRLVFYLKAQSLRA